MGHSSPNLSLDRANPVPVAVDPIVETRQCRGRIILPDEHGMDGVHCTRIVQRKREDSGLYSPANGTWGQTPALGTSRDSGSLACDARLTSRGREAIGAGELPQKLKQCIDCGGDVLYVQRLRARSDVCELFAENVSPFAENVGLKHGVFAKNVSRIERCLWVQVITFVSRYM